MPSLSRLALAAASATKLVRPDWLMFPGPFLKVRSMAPYPLTPPRVPAASLTW